MFEKTKINEKEAGMAHLKKALFKIMVLLKTSVAMKLKLKFCRSKLCLKLSFSFNWF